MKWRHFSTKCPDTLIVTTFSSGFVIMCQNKSDRWCSQGGGGIRIPPLWQYDVTISCIHTNTTKLVLHLSYLVRLDYISNAFDWLVIAIIILAKICIKIRQFYWKICKNLPTLAAPLSNPRHPSPTTHWKFLVTILSQINIHHLSFQVWMFGNYSKIA